MLISHCGDVDGGQAGPTRWAALKLPTFLQKATIPLRCAAAWFSCVLDLLPGLRLLITKLWEGLLLEKLWRCERIIRLYHQRHVQSAVFFPHMGVKQP